MNVIPISDNGFEVLNEAIKHLTINKNLKFSLTIAMKILTS